MSSSCTYAFSAGRIHLIKPILKKSALDINMFYSINCIKLKYKVNFYKVDFTHAQRKQHFVVKQIHTEFKAYHN